MALSLLAKELLLHESLLLLLQQVASGVDKATLLEA